MKITFKKKCWQLIQTLLFERCRVTLVSFSLLVADASITELHANVTEQWKDTLWSQGDRFYIHSKEHNRVTHRGVLAVHSSLFATEVLDFLHSFHLVLICDRARDRERSTSPLINTPKQAPAAGMPRTTHSQPLRSAQSPGLIVLTVQYLAK